MLIWLFLVKKKSDRINFYVFFTSIRKKKHSKHAVKNCKVIDNYNPFIIANKKYLAKKITKKIVFIVCPNESES